MSKESTRLNSIQRLAKLKPVIQRRNKLLHSIRKFFTKESFIEIETPVIIDAPLPEPNIEAISTDNGFLRTSPEAMLKACLAAGYEKIFEIGPCFRKEERGRLHREEFSMLEWYQVNVDSTQLISFTKNLLIHCAVELNGHSKINYLDKTVDLNSDWEIISLKDAFAKFANLTLEESVGKNRFELDLLDKIEPNLPQNKPIIITDYPAKFRAFAKLKDSDNTLADRWELYIAGVEISNTYSELVEPCEIRKLISQFQQERKKLKMKDYPLPAIFMEAIKAGIPKSAGSALGIDRLLMLLTSSNSIEDVKI
ncbi:MAG TPA: hypothetical protein P5105_03335 [Victivallales bacterium]|nr:hypothetical protein [Victivallales bacterium]HRR06293.1 hypothetical protein [Victivallales bacterium]HRR29085.1 hypothetical protein [Victivallales bacterium]